MSNLCHEDRLFPADEATRATARKLYNVVRKAPICSPHGHTDPAWFSRNKPFNDPVSLFITPDHYVLRVLYSHGFTLEQFGVQPRQMSANTDAISELRQREIWRLFAKNFHLFRATPSELWLKHVFANVFDLKSPLSAQSADLYFDRISERLANSDYLPRALYKRFNISLLATTDAATDTLSHHAQIKKDFPNARIIPTYRPDAAIDPEHEDFFSTLDALAQQTDENVFTFTGYLAAHRKRRAFFIAMGATATDHGHPSARTEYLSHESATRLFERIIARKSTSHDHELFRAHMLWRMAEMSCDDGLVMQLHCGSFRNHNQSLYSRFGRDVGADIPQSIEYTRNLQPLLDSFGNKNSFQLILFTLDESCYTRELAPLAGHYPLLRLGAPWWFHDSPEGMLRHRRAVVETTGFYKLTGFIDDTRAFFSIPARHDVARRMDARFLAELVAEHRLSLEEAEDLIGVLTNNLNPSAYRL